MAHVEFWSAGPHAGYRVIWYRDDDNNSGYGDNPRKAVWYVDTHAEGVELAKRKNPPRRAIWGPIT